jgi:Mg/Co/Ni transporter MgtE
VPVVTEEGKLSGLAPLVHVVRASAEAPVKLACRSELPSVRTSATFGEVLGWFEKYHLHALAVVDEFDELLGVINVEDVMTRLARKR